jgi:transcriptional regulator GlxA family with amidase domain
VKVDAARIFIVDDPVWTSAGMTAGFDLALAMESQLSALLELELKSDRIQSVLAYAKRNLDSPPTVEQLAEAAHLGPCQFSRVSTPRPANRRSRLSRHCESRPPAC